MQGTAKPPGISTSEQQQQLLRQSLGQKIHQVRDRWYGQLVEGLGPQMATLIQQIIIANINVML